MSDITELHQALLARVLGSTGQAPPELRRTAFDAAVPNTAGVNTAGLAEPIRTLIDKVAHHANQVTDEDVAAARAAGLSQDEVFEIVVCAAVGQASRQYQGALAALASATKDGAR